MDNIIEKFEIATIDKFIKYLSYNSFLDILLNKVRDSFILSFNNTNEEYDFKVEIKPDPLALENLRTREFILSQKTTENLRGNLRYELLSGMEANESIDEIVRRVSKIFTSNSVNIERICRTEILHSMNAGRMEAYQRSGVAKYKMWQAAVNNTRTAADSKRLHGQIQKLEDAFKDPETGETFMHPPNRPNCRCTLLPLVRLPDSVITIGGQTYAADKKLGKVEIPIDLLKARQKRKAWVVRYANGYAVQCFEDEADTDYFIETSKKKGDGWFDFISKVYREVKPGWVIHRKGTKTTMKFMSPEERKAFDEKLLREDKRVNKIEINTKSLLTTKEITVKGFTDKRGVWHPPHKRKVKVKTSEEIPEKDVPKEDISDKKPISMTSKNLKELKSFEDLGMMGGLHEPGSYRAKFNDDMNAMYKVMNEGAIAGEVSTYDVSKILDWNVVPETISTNLEEKGDGSCQRWVEGGAPPYEGYGDEHETYVKVESKHFDDLSKIFVLDMVTGNYDRHGGNVMIDENDRCWAIDNEDWGTAGSADDFMTSLDDRAEVSDVGGFSPMMRWADKSFEVTDYLTFREKVLTNMRHIVDNEDKITDYYNKYEGSDLLVGGADDEKSITSVLLSIKKNLDYIKTYCGKSK